ncbi:MAG: bifunctional diaminohydroxyphosphoribosylaminopyrimidine deaminase/5-amino-6-(5-phosphoribosylamino)uracil reductase RibD [Gemmatimonadetes bacterium]|nr:bifunctional diaminohydroxyphosphoribosylaminopyrimidine deaminase/5-amino-6-(5-phosphoribosylamino)uracil reductase RibD [Gemmatimonadota bacterium]
MTDRLSESEAMRRAIKLAMGGWGRVAPNPLVGAVLLRNGSVIGEGFHARYGEQHAEIAALAVARDATGATCVVNLEPCAHQGKTPPCASALVSAGVKRVVVGMRDPSPDANGGLEHLRKAGLDVEVGVLAEEAAALNAPFLWSVRRPDRPFVAAKVATSLDGFLADASGRAKWVSGVESRDFVHWLRAGFDGISVGRKTAETDDPQLTVRGAVPPRVTPTRVVFTRGGLKKDLHLVKTAREVPTVVFTDPASHAQTDAALAGSGVEILPAAGREDALVALRTKGIRSLLVEGGGNLITALMQDDLIDRIYWIQAPIFLGSGTRAFGDRSPTLLADAGHWAVTDRQTMGRDTLLVVDRELCLPA